MESWVETINKIAALGWSSYRLHQATGESEYNIRYAIRNPEERDTRKKIAEAVGKSYEELFGESE